ncbi:DUF2809 domain-containing protein [Clostridium sardiniense]|uniref:DUF2809 domain-containing protein n=1 Tax=Clostridium sardiniense TaxID=29369 RepID=A0ABS7KTT4_CLOSR|nr:DUF2809 domain-containing protein [Clostridium sardiniense]MBY0754224.1 DUF2809 domain-containing protein [Clostridium sardiniense]
MILGLASRKYGSLLPNFLMEYSGDALWALMVYFGFSFVFIELSISKRGIIALVFSFSIEISQIYQGVWINKIRATTLGGLILGHGFLVSDLICYTVGISIGLIISIVIENKIGKEKSSLD